MERNRILVLGAGGQLGRELVRVLIAVYGEDRVLASDIQHEAGQHFTNCHFEPLNVLAPERLQMIIKSYKIGQIYHLAAILSANGETDPMATWQVNMEGLLGVLETARKTEVQKVFWPSSIAVFGKRSLLKRTPQHAVHDAGTTYGISKAAGELWCQYYHQKYGLDVRCLRYPGLIGHRSLPGGGTTDYAVDIYHHAVKGKDFNCYLGPGTRLPMLYMPDAVKAALDLMQAPEKDISVRTGYNIQGMSFTPLEVFESILRFYPGFQVNFRPDFRQQIAEDWPKRVDDKTARNDWGWAPKYDLDFMTEDMLDHLERKQRAATSP